MEISGRCLFLYQRANGNRLKEETLELRKKRRKKLDVNFEMIQHLHALLIQVPRWVSAVLSQLINKIKKRVDFKENYYSHVVKKSRIVFRRKSSKHLFQKCESILVL